MYVRVHMRDVYYENGVSQFNLLTRYLMVCFSIDSKNIHKSQVANQKSEFGVYGI